MIVEQIQADHQAGHTILADIGNTTQPAHEERRELFARFATLWAEHGRMMTELVHPALGGTQSWPDPVAAAMDLQREVQGLAADLAAREAMADPDWRVDFVRLQGAFAQLCTLEEVEFMPRLLETPPDRMAELTRRAREGRNNPPMDPGDRMP